jgi:hypothetical protein
VSNIDDPSKWGSSHWARFINHINEPDRSGCDSYSLPRIGEGFPICCPLHHTSVLVIPSSKELRRFPMDNETWGSLCEMVCTIQLQCGHPCGLKCHFSEPNNHNNKCRESVPRPCSRHKEVPLACNEIKFAETDNLESALKKWCCECSVSVPLECGHIITLPCCELADVEAGDRDMPQCNEIVDDYIHPQCTHVISRPKCWIRREYERNPPRCEMNTSVQSLDVVI